MEREVYVRCVDGGLGVVSVRREGGDEGRDDEVRGRRRRGGWRSGASRGCLRGVGAGAVRYGAVRARRPLLVALVPASARGSEGTWSEPGGAVCPERHRRGYGGRGPTPTSGDGTYLDVTLLAPQTPIPRLLVTPPQHPVPPLPSLSRLLCPWRHFLSPFE